MSISPLDRWKEPFGIIIIQNSPGSGDPMINLKNVEDMMRSAMKDENAHLVILPELFATGFNPSIVRDPEMISGRTIDSMRDISISQGVHILFSTPFKDEDKVFNRTFWMDRGGIIRGHYDKTHLFSRTGEDRMFYPGGSLRIFEMDGVPVGVLTCYEIRYPELARTLSGSGAGVIVNSVQWPEFRIEQWLTLLRARAIENQLFVAGANICGTCGMYKMGGRSSVFEPYGGPAGSLGSDPGCMKALLDPEKIERFREKIRMEYDRRSIDRVDRIV